MNRLIAVELLICYLAVLAVISYIRGPVRYRIITDAELQLSGERVSFTDGAIDNIYMENAGNGESARFTVAADLGGAERIRMEFASDCPADYAGGELHVGLYASDEEGAESLQEFHFKMKEGKNRMEASFDACPPEQGFFRFQTSDPAGYDIQSLHVYPEEELPTVSKGLAVGTLLCFAVLGATAVLWAVEKREAQQRGVSSRNR